MRLKLSQAGLQLIDPLREVRGRRLGEHDMAKEVISGGIVEYL